MPNSCPQGPSAVRPANCRSSSYRQFINVDPWVSAIGRCQATPAMVPSLGELCRNLLTSPGCSQGKAMTTRLGDVDVVGADKTRTILASIPARAGSSEARAISAAMNASVQHVPPAQHCSRSRRGSTFATLVGMSWRTQAICQVSKESTTARGAMPLESPGVTIIRLDGRS